jgi:hypothetical protein
MAQGMILIKHQNIMHFEKFSAKMFLSPLASTQLKETADAPEARNEAMHVERKLQERESNLR